jgi:hypothetical protein
MNGLSISFLRSSNLNTMYQHSLSIRIAKSIVLVNGHDWN